MHWGVCLFPTMFWHADRIISSPFICFPFFLFFFFFFCDRVVTFHLWEQHFWTCWCCLPVITDSLCHSALHSAMSGEQVEMDTVPSCLVAVLSLAATSRRKLLVPRAILYINVLSGQIEGEQTAPLFVTQLPFHSRWTQFLLLPCAEACRSFFSRWTQRKKKVEM